MCRIHNRASFFIVCVALLLFIAGCSTAEINKDAESIAISVFGGEVRDDNPSASGIISITHTPQIEVPGNEPIPPLTVIGYRYHPVGVGSLESEVGASLGKRFQALYSSSPEFDHVRLMLQLPFIDDYGNVTWEHSALVVMSRATYESVNWNNFAGESLWLIADEVDRDKRIAWK